MRLQRDHGAAARRLLWIACAVAVLAACDGSGGGGDDMDDDADFDGGADGDTDGDADSDGDPGGLGPWDGEDDVGPTSEPPFGLAPSQVPMFVSIGFDDNAYSGLEGSGGSGGMCWALDLLRDMTNPDDTPARVSFYLSTVNVETWMSESPTFVKRAWRAAYEDGHEIGVHSHSHPHGADYTESQWEEEIAACVDWLTKPFDPDEPDTSPDDSKGVGIPADELWGFRTPYLEYGDGTLAAVHSAGLWYDCSIEEGWQPDQDGTNYFWPFTLDDGSPGHDVLVEWELKEPISGHPGLWEMPVNPVIVPPDDECESYGVPSGLRSRLKTVQSWFDDESGKITGFDYNMWVLFEMSKDEVLATLKYTLDLRLAGNRAPLMFGGHTDYYSDKYDAPPNATVEERQQAIEEFLEYALAKDEVRVVPIKQILDWARNPEPL